MRILVMALVLSACAPISQSLSPVPPGPTDYVENLPPGFSAQKVKADLEEAIIARFGAAALKRAQSAEGHVLSRFYQGMPTPPPPDGKPQLPIAALLILEQSVWYRAETGAAFRPLTPREQSEWLSALSDTGPWAEPTYANPTCTDAGATYLIVSVPNRPFLLRAANCATPKSERLGLAAINL
ncbi:MAG: hypothetical protein AVDCRST_MAG09-1080 [uncultured Sphingomonas sp.]|uniref:Lipoprotein n=1 Tax=uncultured Sphingomonas sp. TaxID=158754 RepID=A0A6J4SVL6_9SPHN|nr:hypothetical protein [uncultured Sphingomonas sp.]CAA9506434.1 MAG: hypothetical protein AVDCRST_MAG09-1080 [uncultured Sphingomonas sp.]